MKKRILCLAFLLILIVKTCFAIEPPDFLKDVSPSKSVDSQNPEKETGKITNNYN